MSSLSTQDLEHVRLLTIFHYIVGGLAVLFSFIPLLYTAMGAFFVYAANHGRVQSGHEPPPEVLGWIFVGFGFAFFVAGLAAALCILLAGRSLAKQRRYWFVFVVACIECLFIPFGTILGVFTVIVLSRESVKTHFLTGSTEAF